MKKRNADELYKEWLREKASVQAPADFSDRVMEAVATPIRPQLESVGTFMKAAVLILAAVAGISRYGLLIYFLIFT